MQKIVQTGYTWAMDAPSPQIPSPLMSPPRAHDFRRKWSRGEIFALSLIIVLAGLRVVEAGIYQREAASGARPNPLLIVACRYAVGLHQLSSVVGGGQFETSLGQMFDDLDRQAKAPEDQLRMAIVHGEIEGPQAAESRLDALAISAPEIASDIAIARSLYTVEPHLEEPAWTRFHMRYGWFADLAISLGMPAGDPYRQHVMNAATRTILIIVGALFIATILTLGGTILLIFAIVRLMQQRIRPAFAAGKGPAPLPEDRRVYLYAFAGFLAVLILPDLFLPWVQHQRAMVLGLALLVGAFVVGLLWPLAAGKDRGSWRMALGLHKGRGFFREIFSGIVGYLAGMPVMALGIVIVIILSRVARTSATHPIEGLLTGGFWTRVAAFALASIWAPITEELMFRGAFFAYLRERFGWWISAPFVAAIFALIHPQGWIALPALASIALVFAGIREWRGSIIGCMAAHSFHNALAMTYLFLLIGQ